MPEARTEDAEVRFRGVALNSDFVEEQCKRAYG
jgi:hypothetical protein